MIYPELAITMKMLYTRNELFVEFISILEKQKEKKLTFQQILEEVVKNKPNLYLNLICPRKKQEEAFKKYQEGRENEIY